MKHSFRLKKSQIKTVFFEKLDIKSVSIENKSDVENAITNILVFNDLDSYLNPIDCSYNFINTMVSFQLELNPERDKKDFFKTIKKFTEFIEDTTENKKAN